MITVIEGRPGTGKTVFLVYKILKYLSYGYTVYTNIDLETSLLSDDYMSRLHHIESLDDIMELREGKIVLDEVQTYLNSRNWDKLDIRFQLLLQQHRKRGLDIIGATQSVKRADVVFRELVHYFYSVKKIFSVKLGSQVFGLFAVVQYDPDTIEKDRSEYVRMGWPRLVVADPFVFRVYDTTQEYRIDDGIGTYVHEIYKLTEKRLIDKKLISKEKKVNNELSTPPIVSV